MRGTPACGTLLVPVPPEEEEIVPLRAPRSRVPPVTHIRSTLISASIAALRGRGRYEEYLARLPKAHHETVVHMVAGVWVPIGVAVAHYETVEHLGFTQHDALEIGLEVATVVRASALGGIVRLAKGAGMTPWTGLPHFQRLWDRIVQGGAAAVYKVGPKEARIEGHGIALAKLAYARAGLRGIIVGSTELFCVKAYVNEIPRLCTPTTLAYRVAWA